ELKVLIIDDNDQDRKGMTIALHKAGYRQIMSAGTETEGVALARTFLPDVVIIDCVLIRLDGFDVCREIKAIEGVNSKIIVITGHLEAVDAAKARKSGADELLEKTVEFKNIHDTIQRLQYT
ncbi:MAG: response regulator, partial [Candidatus Omnitrophota bacterium]